MSEIIDSHGQALNPDPWADWARHGVDDWPSKPQNIVLALPHDLDAASVPLDLLQAAAGIELNFPSFADGRAYTQARKLRERGFSAGIRATGEVLADQLLYMRRCGFDSFALESGQSLATAQLCLEAFKVAAQPSFADQGLRQRLEY